MKLSRREFVATGFALPGASGVGGETGTSLRPRADHDLSLPDWGPYTKKYFGISHVADSRAGVRFDLAVVPCFYRRSAQLPSVLCESGYHPWEASANLDYYAARYELEWKDRVYCDASFMRLTDRARLIRCEFVNDTERQQEVTLHYFASVQFPALSQRVELPEGALWVDALDYARFDFAAPRPADYLVPDGMLRGEVLDSEFVGGAGLGQHLCEREGDVAFYEITLAKPMRDAVLLVRYRAAEDRKPAFAVEGMGQLRLACAGGAGVRLATLALGDVAAGRHRLMLRSLGGGPIKLDGFVVANQEAAGSVRFLPAPQEHRPEILPGPRNTSLVLRYRNLAQEYGMAWSYPDSQVRQFFMEELDPYFRYRGRNHTATTFQGAGDGHFTDVLLGPVRLPPRSRRPLHLVVAGAPERELGKELGPIDETRCENAWRTARESRVQLADFSQQLMAANVLTNVVYPTSLRRNWIKHNTPGRWWDSLYTWDSGFNGLGLLELDTRRAIDCLNTYLTEPGDPHSAYIQHGTPLPVQIHLFQQIWNRTQSEELLRYFYPRVRQMHLFLAGCAKGSTARPFRSGLIATWDYFYNTGWDDYPAQMHVHAAKLERSAASVVSTAHAIRAAKILRLAAEHLGAAEDIALYDEDIRLWTNALQRHSWDEESGYFGYVLHDHNGEPTGILRHESGLNYNMAMGGATPLIPGICTEAQERRLVGHLFSDRRLWTRIGLTTVDRSAPYYRTDGYWNGAVWFPHQWFFWKALLDHGRGEEAHRIARTALEVWKAEAGDTYHCFEHFRVESGRGAGWHQFGGLSSPILSWFAAYHRPGRLTTGFDAWPTKVQFSPDADSLRAELRFNSSGRRSSIIATMSPGGYAVTYGGEPQRFRELYPGTLEMEIDPSATTRLLEIRRS